jgi:hypothetical protein
LGLEDPDAPVRDVESFEAGFAARDDKADAPPAGVNCC